MKKPILLKFKRREIIFSMTTLSVLFGLFVYQHRSDLFLASNSKKISRNIASVPETPEAPKETPEKSEEPKTKEEGTSTDEVSTPAKETKAEVKKEDKKEDKKEEIKKESKNDKKKEESKITKSKKKSESDCKETKKTVSSNNINQGAQTENINDLLAALSRNPQTSSPNTSNQNMLAPQQQQQYQQYQQFLQFQQYMNFMQYQQQNQQRPYQPYSLMGPTPMGYQVMDAVNQPASYANQGLLGAYAPMEMGGAPTRLFGLSNFQLQPSPHYPQQYTINNYYGNGGTPNPYQSSPYQHQNQYSSSPYLAPSMPSSPLDQEMNFSNRLLSERYGNVLGQGQKNAGFQW